MERDGASGHVVVTGESAGGNLAVALLVAAKNVALPLPAAAILMSPMTDLTASGESFTTKAGIDPNITAAAITTRARDDLGRTTTRRTRP